MKEIAAAKDGKVPAWVLPPQHKLAKTFAASGYKVRAAKAVAGAGVKGDVTSKAESESKVTATSTKTKTETDNKAKKADTKKTTSLQSLLGTMSQGVRNIMGYKQT
jgi:hypothetical protein